METAIEINKWMINFILMVMEEIVIHPWLELGYDVKCSMYIHFIADWYIFIWIYMTLWPSLANIEQYLYADRMTNDCEKKIVGLGEYVYLPYLNVYWRDT